MFLKDYHESCQFPRCRVKTLHPPPAVGIETAGLPRAVAFQACFGVGRALNAFFISRTFRPSRL
jgi:hypothetical protein